MITSSETTPMAAPSLFGVSWQKLMMWIFIVSDGLVFAGFLASYGFARLAVPDWPPMEEVFSLTFISMMTFVLITSSATMASAVEAFARKDSKKAFNFILLTVLAGSVFLGMQVIEWSTLIGAGASMNTNPWGASQFGSYFFLITGFHGTHVLSGVVILLICGLRVRAGKTGPEGVELAGLYWHFVDLVWVFIFTLFYLF